MQSIEIVNVTLQKLRSGNAVIENDKLDIKGEWYSNTQKPNWKFEFAKDVCAMANNLSKGDSYLIFGLLERDPFIKNINNSLDEASIQEIIKSKVTPIPSLKIDQIIVEDCWVYVFTISGKVSDLPYFATKSNKDECIFIRRGSSTGLCTKKELDQILEFKREAEFNIHIEAYAIKSIKDISHKIKLADIESISQLLDEIDQYASNYTYKVSNEVLYVLQEVVSRLRFEINVSLTKKLTDIAAKACRLYSLVNTLHYIIPQEHIELINQGLDLGRDIAYRAIRREISEKEFGVAVVLLRDLLRFAILNRLTTTENNALTIFHRLKDVALKNNYSEALMWLNFNVEDAKIITGNELPEFHIELLQKFYY